MKRNGMTRVAGALLTAGLLAGCAASAGPAPATPLTEPTGTLFTGHAACTGEGSGKVDIACEQTASDPRFTGTTTAVGTFTGNGEIVTAWGPATVETADGGWYCDELVMMSENNGIGWREGVCIGRMASPYEGLTLSFHATTGDLGGTWGFIGWIDEKLE